MKVSSGNTFIYTVSRLPTHCFHLPRNHPREKYKDQTVSSPVGWWTTHTHSVWYVDQPATVLYISVFIHRHATTSGGEIKPMQKYPTLKSLSWASPLCLCSWQITWRSASKKWTLEYSFCCYLTLIIRYLCLWDSKTSEGHVGSTFIHLLYKSIC